MKKRSYKQNCSLALASDLLCERWTLLIFRELLIQPCRFKQLNTWLEGMGTNLLTQRLKDLEAEGLIQKQHPGDKRSAYQLTSKGLGLEPLVLSLVSWGHDNLTGEEGFKHFDHWDLLAMKALYKPQNCSQPLLIQFCTEALTAWIKATPQDLTFSLGHIDHADVTLEITIKELQRQAQNGMKFEQPELRKFIAYFE